MNYAWCNCLNAVKAQPVFNLKHTPTCFIRDTGKLIMKCGRIDVVKTEVIAVGLDIVVNKVCSLCRRESSFIKKVESSSSSSLL